MINNSQSNKNIARKIIEIIEEDSDISIDEIISQFKDKDASSIVVKDLKDFVRNIDNPLHKARGYIILSEIYRICFTDEREVAIYEELAFKNIQRGVKFNSTI